MNGNSSFNNNNINGTAGGYGMGMYGGFSWGGKYGKSAYMLFYERRKKKDMKILIAEDKVEE